MLSWFIRELPLRETVTTGDLADTYATPRDTASLAELVNMIGRLERREGAREIVARVAARAGVKLSPAACWLLARFSESSTRDLGRSPRPPDRPRDAHEARAELGGVADHVAARTPGMGRRPPGMRRSSRLRATGEQRLRDLLECWRPEEHEDLTRMIATLAQEFFIDTSALRVRAPAPAPAVRV